MKNDCLINISLNFFFFYNQILFNDKCSKNSNIVKYYYSLGITYYNIAT